MATSDFLDFQQFRGPTTVSGVWQLASGRALSLQPRASGVVRIAQGQVWATFDGPHCGAGNQSGDHVLQAGMQLTIPAGRRLVLEPFERASPQAVLFDWVPDASRVNSRAVCNAPGVAQALQDLAMASRMMGDAVMRLCAGLARYGWPGRWMGSRWDGGAAPECGRA